MMVIRESLPNEPVVVDDLREIAKPGAEGEVRLHDMSGIELDEAGEWRRFPSGWYVEVCRNGKWQREAGPFWGSLFGIPRDAIEAAKRLSS